MNSETKDATKLAESLAAGKARGEGQRQSDSGRPDGGGPYDHGRFDIRIASDGRWYYRGSPIERKPLVKLFSSVLKGDGRGRFWLETPAERGLIEVEDAPFVVVLATQTGSGRQQIISLTTNLDDTVTLDRAHPLRVAINAATGEPRPYVTIRDGLEARLERAVFYDLVALAEDGDGGDSVGVWSAGAFHILGRGSETEPGGR